MRYEMTTRWIRHQYQPYACEWHKGIYVHVWDTWIKWHGKQLAWEVCE